MVLTALDLTLKLVMQGRFFFQPKLRWHANILVKSGADCPNYRKILQHITDLKIIFYFLFEVPQISESPVPSLSSAPV